MFYVSVIKKLDYGQSNEYSGVFETPEQGKDFFSHKLKNGYEIKEIKKTRTDYHLWDKKDLRKLIESHKSHMAVII